MIVRSTKSLLLAVALWAGCAGEEVTRDTSESSTTSTGKLLMPLNATVGTNVYRIAGGYALRGPSSWERTGNLPFAAPSLRFTQLNPGAYELEILRFSVWRSTDGAPEVDVTDRATLPEPIKQVTVASGQTATVTLRFEVEGVPVVISVCDEEPDAIECPGGDHDGDGYANVEECPDPSECVDTDGDGIPDVSDPDSDNDGTPDRREIRETDGRTNPCDPEPTSPACPPGTNINVVTEVDEVCSADECSFDGGTPPTLGEVPSELQPSSIELFVFPTYRPAKGGEYFEDTLAKGETRRLQVVYSGGDWAEPYLIDIDVFGIEALYVAGVDAQSPYHAETSAPSGYAGGFTIAGRDVADEALLVISVRGDEDGDGENEVVARRVVRIEVTAN